MNSKSIFATVLALFMMFVVLPASGFLWALISVPDYEVRPLAQEFGLRAMPLAIVNYYTFRMECTVKPTHRIVTIADRDGRLAKKYLRTTYPSCSNIVLDHTEAQLRGR